MWTFDQLRLVLPAGFEHRADRIARLVAEELGGIPAPANLSLEALALPPLEISRGALDGEIAGRIARSIADAVGTSAMAGRTQEVRKER